VQIKSSQLFLHEFPISDDGLIIFTPLMANLKYIIMNEININLEWLLIQRMSLYIRVNYKLINQKDEGSCLDNDITTLL
jgi:hypothetical protein